jgi:hypothetical protein
VTGLDLLLSVYPGLDEALSGPNLCPRPERPGKPLVPSGVVPAAAQAGHRRGVTVQPALVLVLVPGSGGGRCARLRFLDLGRRPGCGDRGAVADGGPRASFRLGKLGMRRSMPVNANTRSTMALAGMTSRNSPPSARARLCARTRTPNPDESQN